MKGKDNDLEDMDVDDLMAEDWSSDPEVSDDSGPEEEGLQDNNDANDEREDGSRHGSKKKIPAKDQGGSLFVSEKRGAVGKHRNALENLQETDPEFYKFLKNEDQKLLNFMDSDFSDSESDEDGKEKEDSDEEKSKKAKKVKTKKKPEEKKKKKTEEKFHEFDSSKLEVASDEEDFVDEDEQEVKKKAEEKEIVTIAMVDAWGEKLEKHSIGAFRDVVRALTAAVAEIKKSESTKKAKFAVQGSAVFNAVVTLCLKHAHPVLQHVLEIDAAAITKMKLPNTRPKWKTVDATVKSYLGQILKLLGGVGDTAIVMAILRHIHKMVPYFACLPQLSSKVTNTLVEFWSTGEESVRVLAFVCIYSLTRHLQNTKLDFALKSMYLAYVRNTRFTSPSTLPLINFMQQSLTEMFALDTQIAYQHAFIYIRQLAIHLRNAITVKKKDTYKSVYNWQYIHCINLWCRVLGSLHHDDNLKPLVYPLVQTSIGVIKLIPAAKYFPIRFHVVRALNTLSDATGVFIPLLPFILEIFELTDFNKKHSSINIKPINFAVILRLSNSQLRERGFKDGTMDQIYDLVLDILQIHSHCIGFPELALPAILQIKAFLKKCRVANYSRLMKQILVKIEETSKEIEKRRDAVTFGVADDAAVRNWEQKNKEKGTVLSKYWASYRKMRERELKFEEAGKDRMISNSIPTVSSKERLELAEIERQKDQEDFKGLFHGDSDSEDDILVRAERKQKRLEAKKRGQKLYGDVGDDLSDLNDDELEELSNQDYDGDDSDDNYDDDDEVSEKLVPNSDKNEKDISKYEKRKNVTKGQKRTEIFKVDEDEDDVVEDFELWSEEEGAPDLEGEGGFSEEDDMGPSEVKKRKGGGKGMGKGMGNDKKKGKAGGKWRKNMGKRKGKAGGMKGKR